MAHGIVFTGPPRAVASDPFVQNIKTIEKEHVITSMQASDKRIRELTQPKTIKVIVYYQMVSS